VEQLDPGGKIRGSISGAAEHGEKHSASEKPEAAETHEEKK